MLESVNPQISELTVAGFRHQIGRLLGQYELATHRPKAAQASLARISSSAIFQPSKPHHHCLVACHPTISCDKWIRCHVAALSITTGSECTQLET